MAKLFFLCCVVLVPQMVVDKDEVEGCCKLTEDVQEEECGWKVRSSFIPSVRSR
jgi:hypothetical protein